MWIDDGYYQTNGQDGLTFVGTTAPELEVTGGQWYNPETGGLYVYDGNEWRLIDMAGTLTTEDMAINALTIDGLEQTFDGTALVSAYSTSGRPTQGTYNRWVFRSLAELEAAVLQNSAEPPVGANNVPPQNPVEGDLWFDTETLNLYIFYIDNDSGQWVAAFNSFHDNQDFNELDQKIDDLDAEIAAKLVQTEETINNLPLDTFALASELNTTRDQLQGNIDGLTSTVGDLNRFSLAADVNQSVSQLGSRITTLENTDVDLTDYATLTNLATTVSTINAAIDSATSSAEAYTDQQISAVTASIPDISGKVNQSDLDSFIASAAASYLTKSGGSLLGKVQIRKADITEPLLDFSEQSYYGNKVFKFKTNSTSEQYAEFGTNDQPWEYAWSFNANEDFCWKHTDAGKVFSITEQGPACEKLTIGSFGANTSGGRNITSVVEVGERLRTYQAAFQEIRSAANNSNDFDTFKTRLLEAVSSI